MGRFLDIIRDQPAPDTTSAPAPEYDKNDNNDQSPPAHTFGRYCRFGRSFDQLERRRPEHIEAVDWQQAVEDGRQFLARWGEQAERLGWAPEDLFGLAPVPDKPRPVYRRLARHDRTGLVWMLRGRQVIALTEQEAVLRCRSGSLLTFRRTADHQ